MSIDSSHHGQFWGRFKKKIHQHAYVRSRARQGIRRTCMYLSAGPLHLYRSETAVTMYLVLVYVPSEPRQWPITFDNTQTRLVDVLDAVAACELHASLELGMEGVEHGLNTLLAIVLQERYTSALNYQSMVNRSEASSEG